MKFTLGTAAKHANVSKPTISRAIKEGRISAEKRPDGSYAIDPAELDRWKDAYGHRHSKVVETVTPASDAELQAAKDLAEAKLEMMKEMLADRDRRIDDLQGERDAWRDQAKQLALPAPRKTHKGHRGWFGLRRVVNQ